MSENIPVKAAGHFKETQKSAIVEAVLNIVISVVLVWKLGLIGVAAGTLVAVLYRMVYLMIYTNRNLVKRNGSVLVKQYLTDVLAFGLAVAVTRGFEMGGVSYFSWGILAIKTATVAGLVSLLLNVALYKDMVLGMLKKISMKKE